MPERDPPDELYESAVGNAQSSEDPQVEPDVVESNSSNYGGSALDDSRTQERVLHDD